MLNFEPKISGTKVTGFENIKGVFHSQIVSLEDAMKTLHRQESMDFLLDTFRFSLCADGVWRAVIGWDDDFKLDVLENHPEYEQEFIDYFGEKWMKHYIRFNH